MKTFAGIDIAKEVHWVCTIDSQGTVPLNRKLLNTPEDLNQLVAEVLALPQPVRIGIDVLGGIAALAQAVLLQAGFALVHVPGLAVIAPGKARWAARRKQPTRCSRDRRSGAHPCRFAPARGRIGTGHRVAPAGLR